MFIRMCKIRRGWDAAAIKYNELGKGEGAMKFGAHIKGN